MRLKPLEREIQTAIIEAVWRVHGIKLYRTDAGGAGMRHDPTKPVRGTTGLPAGFPDLLGIIPPHGRALFIEVKRPGQKPRQNQLDMLALFAEQGAVAFWADSVDGVLSKLKEAGLNGRAA